MALLDERVRKMVATIVGKRLDDDERDLICLDGPFGGFGGRPPSADALPAFVSTCIKLRSMILALSASIGRQIHGTCNDAACSAAIDSLRTVGLSAQDDTVAFENDARI